MRPCAVPLPDAAAGTITTDRFFVPDVNSSDFTLLGVYDETNKLITMAFPNYQAPNEIGTAFNGQFGPFMETSIVSALMSNDTVTVMNFAFYDFNPMYFGDGGDVGGVVNFSLGADAGSLLAEIIPEPSPLLLVGLGALVISLFHRKQGHSTPFVTTRLRCR